MKTSPALVALALCATELAPAAQSLEWIYRTDGPEVHEAFEEVRLELQASSAVIRQGRREIQYATVVSPDGYLLTKASELVDSGDVSVIVDRETFDEWELVAEDPVWDVALIRVPASGLTPVRLATDDTIEQGTWVVANGATTRSRRRVQVGIVAANTREVFPKGGAVLGVRLDESGERLRITEVTEGSGAAVAGLEAEDLVLSIDGAAIADLAALHENLSRRQRGDRVRVGVERGGDLREIEVELSGRADLFGEEPDRNDAMSGEYSARRSGFPRVLQHDIIGNRHSMGGPLLNLEGECVGMNIARFSRSETYAIPAAELQMLIDSLLPRRP